MSNFSRPSISSLGQKLHTFLEPGQVAPRFEAKDVFGVKVNLSSYHNEYVLVAFMRYAGCPFCNLAVHRLAIEYPILQENGCDAIVFVQSEKEEIIKNIYDRHAIRPPFPIIADHDRVFYDMYGVQSSISSVVDSITDIPQWLHAVRDHGFKQGKLDGNFFLVPAMYLISNRSKKIVKRFIGSSMYDHAAFTEIYETLNFSQTD